MSWEKKFFLIKRKKEKKWTQLGPGERAFFRATALISDPGSGVSCLCESQQRTELLCNSVTSSFSPQRRQRMNGTGEVLALSLGAE